MTIDVIDLRDFYSQRLGIVARRLINRGIHARWPNAQGQRVLGLGYPTPYLGLFREDSERCIAFMPAAQGVLKGPTARRPWQHWSMNFRCRCRMPLSIASCWFMRWKCPTIPKGCCARCGGWGLRPGAVWGGF